MASATGYARSSSSRSQAKPYMTADQMIEKASAYKPDEARKYLLEKGLEAKRGDYSVKAISEVKKAVRTVMSCAYAKQTLKFEGQAEAQRKKVKKIESWATAMLGAAYIKQAESQTNSGDYQKARVSFTNAAKQYGSIFSEGGMKNVNARLAKLFVVSDKSAKGDLDRASGLAAKGNYGGAGDVLVGLHQKYAHEGNWQAADAVWKIVNEMDTAASREKRKDMGKFVNNDKNAIPYLGYAKAFAENGDYSKALVQLRRLQIEYKRKGDSQASAEVGKRIEELARYIKPKVEAEAMERNERTRKKGKANLKATRGVLENLFGS